MHHCLSMCVCVLCLCVCVSVCVFVCVCVCVLHRLKTNIIGDTNIMLTISYYCFPEVHNYSGLKCCDR